MKTKMRQFVVAKFKITRYEAIIFKSKICALRLQNNLCHPDKQIHIFFLIAHTILNIFALLDGPPCWRNPAARPCLCLPHNRGRGWGTNGPVAWKTYKGHGMSKRIWRDSVNLWFLVLIAQKPATSGIKIYFGSSTSTPGFKVLSGPLVSRTV